MKKFLISLLIPFFCFGNSVGEDNNAFSFALYSQIDREGKNVAISPYGIFSNLALLYVGAQGNTAKQLKNALHLSATGDKFTQAFQKHRLGLTKKAEYGYELSIANALFPHQGTHFLTKYKDLASTVFDAKLQSLDYEVPDSAIESINNWVMEKQMVKSIKSSVKMTSIKLHDLSLRMLFISKEAGSIRSKKDREYFILLMSLKKMSKCSI